MDITNAYGWYVQYMLTKLFFSFYRPGTQGSKLPRKTKRNLSFVKSVSCPREEINGGLRPSAKLHFSSSISNIAAFLI